MKERTLYLRPWREFRFLTQAELAAKAEVSRDTVAKIEAGNQTPRIPTVRKLAVALETQPVNLYRLPAEDGD